MTINYSNDTSNSSAHSLSYSIDQDLPSQSKHQSYSSIPEKTRIPSPYSHSLIYSIDQALSSQSKYQSYSSISEKVRIKKACDLCKLRKIKCDNVKPRCLQCVRRGNHCTFATTICKRGPKPKNFSCPYPDCEENLSKSISFCNYPSYNNHSQVAKNNSLIMQVHGFSYSQQPANINCNLRLSTDYSSNTKAEFEQQKLPPIQRDYSALPPPISSTSLRLPSSTKSFNLPPISMLLNYENTTSDRSSIAKPITSPGIYKLNNNTKNSFNSASYEVNTSYKKSRQENKNH